MPATTLKIKLQREFTEKLMAWHVTNNKRIMPWKGEKDPYKVWISEIILQQTRVEQGLEYYSRFIKKFPSVQELAEAEDAEVFKLWEGLGYYSRCKNLLSTGRYIADKLRGEFPITYDEILSLKGIGPYTAAAISSFAYGLPHAVVDGNVFRVLARYFGESLPIDSAEGKKAFMQLAQRSLDKNFPGDFNQAIMDFGATICKPKSPACQDCCLKQQCLAFKKGLVNKLPVKEKKLQKTNRWFYYFIFLVEDRVLVNKRTGKDIWQSLNEFYLYEAELAIEWSPSFMRFWLREQLGIEKFWLRNASAKMSQHLTHQNLQGQFFVIELAQIPESLLHLQEVLVHELSSLAFPKFINQYLQNEFIITLKQEKVSCATLSL